MKISELSPEIRLSSHESQSQILEEIEVLIKEAEGLSPEHPLPEKVCLKLQKSISRLSTVTPLSNSSKLQIWKLSYRLWNACVDLSNAIGIRSSATQVKVSEDLAKLRQISADLLLLGQDVKGIPSPAFKSASFFYKAGLIWHDMKKYDLAANCFEKATDLTSKVEINEISDSGERKLLLDLNIARSRTAWEVSDRNLSLMLLNRSKNMLFGYSESYKTLANQYMIFGRLVLSQNQASALNDALKLMNEALDLCEKGLRAVSRTDEALALKTLRSKCLRFMAAAHLQGEEFESVLKCIRVLREGDGSEDQHPSLPVLAMKAWLGLEKCKEAEKELKSLAVNKGIPEGIWVSAIEAYFQAAGVAGAETAKGVFLELLGRCHVSAAAAVRVVHRIIGSGGDGSRLRANVVAELVSDERVVALFAGETVTKERTAMHAVLWNCGADHFRSKDYEMSAEMFEMSLLYVPRDMEHRVVRAKCFRVLCLCHLGLSQLDQAEEFIDQANKLDPNISCFFLKFKIYLQKNDETGAINQMHAMPTCIDFTPDFLTLSAHEAIACGVLPVAVASLANLLNFYSPGKPMPTPEVVVFRTLITILAREPNNESEILKFMKRTQSRMSDLGHECFFGKGEVGKRERNWFAMNSWNIGTRNGREKNYELCAEFLQLASEFYGATLEGEVDENVDMVCKSLILCVSAKIASEKEKSGSFLDSDVKRAIELLDRAGKILTSSSSRHLPSDLQFNIEPRFFFIHTLNAYDLYGRLGDSGPKQLHLIKSFASSKACSPQYLLQLGLIATQGPRSNPDVANFALNSCLTALLSSPSPDYQNIALIIRKLIGLSSFHKSEADDEAYSMYKQACRIMVGLKEGEYPIEEGKWLVITAWNRAALPVRLGQVGVARRWMKIGLELAQYIPGMVGYRSCMEEFVAGFDKKFYSHDDAAGDADAGERS
ncbi:PREDICTED: TPR repeat-containing protein ZIP4 [Nelumbo nucifera]|uniref:Protein ZIP4 homolog n=2 Tax=Nelumbo nucifera TaxID=4432 RepID=A0A822Y227_NELNU|nr:PREDICTED: TPR repeat-containing protein ZIP4 [Nelumbo nucifera]DAD25115.1 TPA_asm: hypothetical protein HUJ06_026579 [Nelumbo nucifera]